MCAESQTIIQETSAAALGWDLVHTPMLGAASPLLKVCPFILRGIKISISVNGASVLQGIRQGMPQGR